MSETKFTRHNKKKYIYYNNRVTDKDEFCNYLKHVVTLITGGHLVQENVSQTDLIIRTILML
jgi:hypothetical protein